MADWADGAIRHSLFAGRRIALSLIRRPNRALRTFFTGRLTPAISVLIMFF
jgi:hypothetical protein